MIIVSIPSHSQLMWSYSVSIETLVQNYYFCSICFFFSIGFHNYFKNKLIKNILTITLSETIRESVARFVYYSTLVCELLEERGFQCDKGEGWVS